ncbi:MAG TPA: SusC/RagA family TonB-linked outer membrane protein, partial [Balneolales bacterium]|nr:SusC/RagA family TonB-linked outer membrane protein [Balneolales bacterium]
MKKRIRSFLLLLTILGFTSCLYSVKAQAYTNEQKLLSDNSSGFITLKNVLKTIERKYDVTFLYKTDLVSDKYVSQSKALSTDLFQLLYATLRDNNLRLKRMGKTLFVILSAKDVIKPKTAEVKELPVHGKVTDAKTGEALPGVNIMLKGSEKGNIVGTTTDGNGNYALNVPDSNGILLFSYIGYKTAAIHINGRGIINVGLQDTTIGGKEVVVTALGIKRHERSLGYSVQTVRGSSLQKVQGVDVETSLTGKVAGLLVENSTGFTDEPTITLRGETPLLVIDGVPYTNLTLRDVPADNIKNISVLKGATASALYGDRGASGAIMVTTKNGSGAKKGLTVSYNANTMFNAGFLAIPKVQSTFGRKVNTATNTYARTADGSWGVPMDGRQVIQWDPISKSLKSMPYLPIGKNNFQNYLEPGYIMNNNLSVTENGDSGSLRAAASWLQNKGQYPNSMFNKITYNLAGEMQKNQFSLSSSLSFTHQYTPNMGFRGYTAYNPMYSMLIWGTPDYNVLQYKNYWLVPNESQNDSYTSAVNNPYFNAYQRTHSESRDVFNGSLAFKYDIMPWLKATYRVGFDTYNDKQEITISEGSLVSAGSATVLLNGSQVWGESKKGSYNMGLGRGYSVNNDLLLSGEKTIKDFKVSGFAGGTIYYNQDEGMEALTRSGLSIPGFYSLASSINPVKVDSRIYKQQVNSLYGQLALSWRNLVYADGTLRNDWSSTMPASNSSYMYPSASMSFVASQLLPKIDWLSFWKIRASWASSKTPPTIYEVNSVYNITNNAWGNLNSASYPTTIRGNNVLPQASSTFELGTAFDVFQNRASLDVAVYKKRMYDFLVATGVDPASGFYSNYVNTQEETARKGIEITANVTPVRTSEWHWDVSLNWSAYAEFYTKLDSIYSPDNS